MSIPASLNTSSQNTIVSNIIYFKFVKVHRRKNNCLEYYKFQLCKSVNVQKIKYISDGGCRIFQTEVPTNDHICVASRKTAFGFINLESETPLV